MPEDLPNSEVYWDNIMVIKVRNNFSAPIDHCLYYATELCAG